MNTAGDFRDGEYVADLNVEALQHLLGRTIPRELPTLTIFTSLVMLSPFDNLNHISELSQNYLDKLSLAAYSTPALARLIRASSAPGRSEAGYCNMLAMNPTNVSCEIRSETGSTYTFIITSEIISEAAAP